MLRITTPYSYVIFTCVVSGWLGVGCQDVQAQEVEVPDSGRGPYDQELEEPEVADTAQL